VVIDAEYEEIDPTEGELDLPEDDSLPWLEADEDDAYAGGVDTGQVIGFAVILLVLLGTVIGGVWYFTNQPGDGAPIADGSTIEAPDTPIKERPEDPGGKEFAGTGNVAPAVGEGQVREGQIASSDGSDEAPQPSISTVPVARPDETPPTAPAPVASSSSSTTSTGGVGVQLAAYSSRSRADTGWRTLSRQTDLLSGMKYRVVEGVVDGNTVYRLQAVTGSRAEADKLCRDLKAQGLDCAVKP
jgi:hypothetical protein